MGRQTAEDYPNPNNNNNYANDVMFLDRKYLTDDRAQTSNDVQTRTQKMPTGETVIIRKKARAN